MRILVFGATGPTGRHVVDQALAAGHRVTAFARDPDRVRTSHEALAVALGDVLDAASVHAAMEGHDGVVSVLGTVPWSSEPVVSQGTRHLLAAMAAHGVRRLAWLSAFGVAESRAQAGPFGRLMYATVLRRPHADKALGEQAIRAADPEWVIVRPAVLTNGPRTDRLRVGTELRLSGLERVSRADVAAVLLASLADDTHLRTAVSLAPA